MTSLQHAPGVTPYPQDVVDKYVRAGLWGERRIEQLIADAAAHRPDAAAVIDTDGTTTYWELIARAERAAGMLAARGLRSEDDVVMQMPNCTDTIALLLGAFRLGVRPILALGTHRGAEIAGFVRAGRATHWILGDLPGVNADDLVADVRDRLGHDLPVTRWTRATATSPAPDRSTPTTEIVPATRPGADAAELAFFQLSGGTTGASKLIARAHREYAYSFLRSNELCGIDSDTVLVITLPLTHNFPMSSPGFLGVLSAGGTVVLPQHSDPASLCAAVQHHRATHLVAVPPLVQVLLDSHARTSWDLSSLRRVIVGGARLSPAVARRVHAELGGLQQVYGMAEGLVCYTDPGDDPETIVTTQGRPMSPLDEIRVVDTAGRPVATGVVGELQARGPYTIRGYYFGGDRERASFTADGYYRTGDLVRRDDTGSITVVGRTKEQINRGGEKVSPVEVEDALLRHPGVHDACVVGEPDELLGERVVAYVVPRDLDDSGAQTAAPLDRRALRTHLIRQSLAPFKIPDRYHVLDRLPTTAVGKVARRRVNHPDGAPTPPVDLDVLGVGFGPANMALAVAVREANQERGEPLRAAFFDAAPDTRWHPGLLFEDASMQVAFAKDLATLRNPRSAFTFVQFLAERGRLVDFVNRGSMTPLRVEFVEYLRWAASKLADDVTYAARVETICPVIVDGTIRAYDVDVSDARGLTRWRARHVVLAAGLQPQWPKDLCGGPRVWHSSEHLARVHDLDPDTTRDVVVLGAGQSAAEIVTHLHADLPQARIHAVHGRFGYVPSDSSPFANQIFDPDTVDVLYDAPQAERARLDAIHANTNDAVVNPVTLANLYDLQYRDRWLGRDRLVWHRCTRLLAARESDDAIELDLHDHLTDQTHRVRTDAVVCATGYRPLDPATLLGDAARMLRRNDTGRPLARRNYAAQWSEPDTGHLFLVGQTRHQHGLTATLLSNVAVRAGEILDAITEPPSGAASTGPHADRSDTAPADDGSAPPVQGPAPVPAGVSPR